MEIVKLGFNEYRLYTIIVISMLVHGVLAFQQTKPLPILSSRMPISIQGFIKAAIPQKVSAKASPAAKQLVKPLPNRRSQTPPTTTASKVSEENKAQKSKEQVQQFRQDLQRNLNEHLSNINLRRYYPKRAILQYMEDTINLKLTFNAKGELLQVFPSEKSKYPLLERAALSLIDDHKDQLLEIFHALGLEEILQEEHFEVIAPIAFELAF